MVPRTLSRTALFRQVLWGVAMFMVLGVILGVLAGALVIAGICMVYHTLLLNGLEPTIARLTTGAIALLITILLYGVLNVRIQRLQNSVVSLLKMQSPISSHLNDITESFMDGLMGTSPSEKTSERTL